ncbi:MAG: NAD(P)/FAD-dependent oxidoreductase [Kiloniellales bacterium]
MKRLYHASAYDPAVAVDSHWRASAPPPRHSFPKLTGAISCDVAIIGAGYTGLSAALRLAENHGADVRVLEAGEPGWGASGRNGGFCCLGSTKLSQRTLVRRYGAAETARFRQVQRQAVEQVRGFLTDRGIEADIHSDGELYLAHRPGRDEALRREAEIDGAAFGVVPRVYDRKGLEALGAAGPQFHAGLQTPIGFALHPLKYARALADAAADAGARVHGQSGVLDWSVDGERHRLTLAEGEVSARRVILATNGYGSETLPRWLGGRSLPVMSNILVTRPLTAAEKAAQGWTTDLIAFDSRHLLNYFRLLPDGRFLFGGRGGLTASPRGVAAMRVELHRRFERLFPAWRGVESERFWWGLACLAYDLVPYVGPIEGLPHAWTALAYHGNGVAMTSWTGSRLADLAAGVEGAAEGIPAVMRGPMRRFPFPALRKLYLRAAYAWFGLADRWL